MMRSKRWTLVATAMAMATCLGMDMDAHAADGAAVEVTINGWYRCNPSTLWREGEDWAKPPSDDYYLETSSDVGEHGSNNNNKHKHKRKLMQRELKEGWKRYAPAPRISSKARGFVDRAFDRSWREQRARREATSDTHHQHQDAPVYECAEFTVPLCYEGICDSDATTEVFVRRVVASVSPPRGGARAKSLWVLQGGPGASSAAMEDLLESMHAELNGEVSIYTMDHRGTARSNRLECQAAEAQMPGSPGGTTITVDEVPQCIDDLLFQIDNQTAAFSVTSAAMDLRTVIEYEQPDEDVFVYGLSYGTYLVERLIHVAPANVRGFIVDGIVSEAGSTVEERSTFSNWDHDMGQVGERFLAYCLEDAFCQAKFPGVSNLTALVKQLYVDLDDAAAKHPGSNACADALAASGQRPSYLLRSAMGNFLMSSEWQVVIPAIIYRAARCSDADVDALAHMVWYLAEDDEDAMEDPDMDDVLFMSEMLYNLIVFSEMWETPTPDKATLVAWYEEAVMASDNYYMLPYYCLFTGSQEKACRELTNLPASQPMVYPRDQYWNQVAELPANTTALLLSGGLDTQTRWMYGTLEYDALVGDRMKVEFDYAGHCTTFTTPTHSGGSTCGVQILASYVRVNGVLKDVDTSCVADTLALDFHGDAFFASVLFGAADLYESQTN